MLKLLRKMNQQTKIKIQNNWQEVKLGSLFSLEYGKGLPERERSKGNVKVFGSNGIVGYHSKPLVEGPGIIVGRKGTIGAVVYTDEDFYPIDTTYFIKLKDKKINWKWLFYKLISMRLNKLNSATGTPGLNRDIVYSQKTSIPIKYEEQNAIAEILSITDSKIELIERERRATEQLRRGIMKKLLEEKKWPFVRFESICKKIRSGGTPLTSKKEYYNGKIPFVKIEDITNAGKYLSNTQIKISKEGLDNSTAWIVPKNSLLLAIYGSLGEVTINTINVATNQAILGIILDKDKANTDYVYYFFKNIKLIRYAKQSTQANLTAEIIKNLEIPLPPIREQKHIAEILNTIDKKLGLQKLRKEKIEKVKKGLMNELLTGKKRLNVEKVLKIGEENGKSN